MGAVADEVPRTSNSLERVPENALGSFLVDRRRRSGLSATADELTRRPYRRKSPAGLRSVEVAARAGIDPGYYAKLEQGRARSPSPEVIQAIGRALELSEAERQHLVDLVSLMRGIISEPDKRTLPAGTRELLDALPDAPAMLMDHAYDILAWNDGICAVFGDPAQVPVENRNIMWWMFSDPSLPSTIEDWAGHAQRLLAQFRLDWGRHPAEPRFEQVIRSLTQTSPEFRLWWPRRDVQGRLEMTKQVCPPAYGKPITFIQTTWMFSTSPGLRLTVYAPDGQENVERARECIRAYPTRQSRNELESRAAQA
jgi:transcriptional regulator with XRE-family HTH domain